MQLNRVFVYGSLKRGGRFHGVLQRARFLGEARTCESYLLHLGWQWPLLVETAPARWRAPICGEVYEVSPLLLRKLDVIEDNGHLYQRKPICVQLEKGVRCEAWCYFAKAPKLLKLALKRPKTRILPEKGCQIFEVKN